MRINWLRYAVLLAGLAVAGCGWGRTKVAPEEAPTRLGDNIQFDVAHWLTLSRPELAKLVEERAFTVAKQTEHARTNPDSVELLPHLHPPIGVPVFAQATFSRKAGLSLPPYVKEDTFDRDVSLHLARHGDFEGSLILADPADKALHGRLEALKATKNYPVEWSRLVGLTLQSAQLKLANGEPEGAAELVGIHKQLRALLDRKVATSWLRSALLPIGRRTLCEAVLAYRNEKTKKPELANDIETALKEWGDLPTPGPAVPFGARAADVARLFGVAPQSKSVIASTPSAVARSLDLLGLPLTGEGVQSIVAFLGDHDQFAELLVVYRAKVEGLYPEPAHLAHYLIDLDFSTSKEPNNAPGLLRRTYKGDGLVYDVARVSRPCPYGAFVRVVPAKGRAPAFASSARHLGPASFDRPFEATRVALLPSKSGTTLTITKGQSLAELVSVLGTPAPEEAVLQREKDHDLLASATLSWTGSDFLDAPTKLLPPLWSALGSPRLSGAQETTGGYIAFTWEDDTTRVQLRLPFNEKSPVLSIEDRQGSAELAERSAAVQGRDLADRAARIKAGNPARRLHRDVAVIEGVELGQARADAEDALPRHSASVRKRAIDRGWAYLFLDDPTPGATHWRRELFVRFANDRVAELRVRYETGLANGKGRTLLQTLEDSKQGKPETIAGDWPGLWGDLANSKSRPVKYRWQDDVTTLTYQRDAGAAEVVLRDRPADLPDGPALPRLVFLKRGVGPANLGDQQAAVRTALKGRPGKAGQADVYRLGAGSPYEYVMIWYQDGRVSRLVAAHKARPNAAAPTAALSQVWQAGMDELGFVRRRVGRQGSILERYFWHDDRTRVQSFVQNTPDGPLVFTEWRDWPVPVEKLPGRRR